MIWALCDIPAYCVKSFQIMAQARGTQIDTADSLISGDGTGSEGTENWLEFAGQSTREERTSQKENYKDLQRVIFKYSKKYYCPVHAYEETT